jgi:hypothetical protein
MTEISVTVKCVMCGSKREIGPNEETRFSVPMCPNCFSPMVAESATASDDSAAPSASTSVPEDRR